MINNKLSYEENVKLLELLDKYDNYARECYKNEYDTDVLDIIRKTRNEIRDISNTIRLDF